jgi:uncharacterized protein YjbJ (UPF0337 family)
MMNKEQLSGKYDQFKGKLKETWGKLTDDDIATLEGKSEQFYGKVKEHYGIEKEAAEKKVKELKDSCGCGSANKAA